MIHNLQRNLSFIVVKVWQRLNLTRCPTRWVDLFLLTISYLPVNDRAVSLQILQIVTRSNPHLLGMYFSLWTIDPSKSTTPFASIKDISYFKDEDEVLFAMQTVFALVQLHLWMEIHVFSKWN